MVFCCVSVIFCSAAGLFPARIRNRMQIYALYGYHVLYGGKWGRIFLIDRVRSCMGSAVFGRMIRQSRCGRKDIFCPYDFFMSSVWILSLCNTGCRFCPWAFLRCRPAMQDGRRPVPGSLLRILRRNRKTIFVLSVFLLLLLRNLSWETYDRLF